jgi:D-amino-acid dehydrogenase
VVVIDRTSPGEGATYGNAGCLNGSSVVPVAMPGVLKNVPGWLLNPEGPLVMRWGYLPTLAPWLMRFVASGQAHKVAEQARALRSLVGGSLADYAPLVRDAGLADLLHARGHLIAYTTEAGYQGDTAGMRLRADNGVDIEELGQAALREYEPDLAPAFIRARRIAETGHLTDPGAFTKRLAAEVMARGGRFVQADITGLRKSDARVTGVVTRQGVEPAKAVVIALGAWSAPLARELGDRVLLDTERGYHIEVPGAEYGPRVPTVWNEGKMFATPMQERVRCAGTVEFAGLNAPADWRRTDLLGRQLRKMYPAIGTDIDRVKKEAGELPRWLGFRPSTPDSLPVIGPSRQFPNAIYAFGHGHIGLTSGAPTAKVVSRLLSGEAVGIDLSPFSIKRFN